MQIKQFITITTTTTTTTTTTKQNPSLRNPTGWREKLGTRLGLAFLCKLGLLLFKPQV